MSFERIGLPVPCPQSHNQAYIKCNGLISAIRVARVHYKNINKSRVFAGRGNLLDRDEVFAFRYGLLRVYAGEPTRWKNYIHIKRATLCVRWNICLFRSQHNNNQKTARSIGTVVLMCVARTIDKYTPQLN